MKADWIPWHASRFDEAHIPAFGDAAVPYRAIPLAAGVSITCRHARCEQNYFEQRFLVEGQHLVGFHAGLN